MGIFSSLFGGGKKSKAPGPPAYKRPGEPVSALDNFARFSSLTPWKDAAGGAATAAAGRLGGPGSGILAMLQDRAKEGLAAGGDISAEEIRAATQGGRAAASARGTLRSPSGILQEILSRAQYATARRQQREGFAAGVVGMENAQAQQDQNTLQTTSGSVLAGLALPETVRQYDTTRNDTLTFNENSWNMDQYTADKNAAQANKAGKQSVAGAAIGGILSFL